jgi:hypothetical protein
LVPQLLLNAAVLLLPYKDRANLKIITQLSKLMHSSIQSSRKDLIFHAVVAGHFTAAIWGQF